MELPPRPAPPLPVAVSECLTGSAVRYDGTDAHDSFPHDALEGLLSLVPICPEVGVGMGVPRPPIQLVGDPRAPRVLGVRDSSIDVTEALAAYVHTRSTQLDGVYGYVFMERSPSCGLYSVPVHAVEGDEPPSRTGRGAYASAVLELNPDLPAEENGRLFDAEVRESFLDRVFAYAHWRRLSAGDGRLSPARLMAFHSRYKYLLMAHSVPHYRQAGRLLGNAPDRACRAQPAADTPPGDVGDPTGQAASNRSVRTDDSPVCPEVRGPTGRPARYSPACPEIGGATGQPARYLKCLMSGLAKPATRGGHANVLSHLQGYLSHRLHSAERRELAGLIEEYRRGGVSLAEPRGLLLRHLAEHPDPYLADQVYLRPLGQEG